MPNVKQSFPPRTATVPPEPFRMQQLQGILWQVGMIFGCAVAMRGQLYGTFTPFGLALLLGSKPRNLLCTFIGVLLGAFCFAKNGWPLVWLCVFLAVGMTRWLFAQNFFISVLTACVCLPILSVVLSSLQLLPQSAPMIALAQAFASCMLGWVLYTFPPVQHSAGQLTLGCMATVLCAGLPSVFSWISIVCIAVIGMILSYRAKQRFALVAALVLSLSASSANAEFQILIGGLVLASFAAAQFGADEKPYTIGFYLLGCLPAIFALTTTRIYTTFSQGATCGLFFASILLSALIFICIPKRLLEAQDDAHAHELETLRPPSVAAMQLDAVAQSLSGIAQTVNDVYRVLPHKEETFNWVIETMQETLCQNCNRRATCWGKQYDDMMDGLFALKPLLEEHAQIRTEQLPIQLKHCAYPAALASEMTRAYGTYQSKIQTRIQSESLRNALTEQYSAVAAALEGLSVQLEEPSLPEKHKTRRVIDFFASIGIEPLECAVTQELLGRLRIAVTLPHMGFREEELKKLAHEVSKICNRSIDVPQKLSCRGLTTLIFNEKPILRPIFGHAWKAAKGEISGDAVQQFCRVQSAEMILCDGMGTGCPAAVDGNLAAELTARLLKAQFTPQTAARLVNIALSLKSEEESGATLDLLSVDLYSGLANFFKAGAAPAFVVQDGIARAIGSESLPIGIVDIVEGQSLRLQLHAGDYAILVSDGMLIDGNDWILQQITLSAASGQKPSELATLLVKTACARAESHANYRADDITAAVLLLEKCL